MLLVTRLATCLIFPLLMILVGCEPAWRTQFSKGTRLYDRTDHHLFGRVVGFAEAHDFNNGTSAEPAVLIEQENDHTTIWGSCATCAASFDLKPPQ